MNFAKVTSVEVAARAGVSQSAVSRVFTPGASVSQKTADKVRKAANELGYRPNILARSLITGKSRMIGFVVAYLDNQFYPESLEKLSKRLQAEGYHILIFTVNNEKEEVQSTVEDLLNYQVEAIIAASVSMSNEITKLCRAANVPIVLYNRSQDDADVSFVTSDNIKGGQKIAEHFVQIGVKRPAYIAGWEDASTQRDREIGYTTALKNAGLVLHDRAVGGFNMEQAKDAARQMFSQSEIPDAVFCANDHMAFGVMDVLRFELGLKIPEDVVVAGYDDVAISSWPSYDLTSVRQAANRMSTATVDIILHLIENPKSEAKHLLIEGPLMVRGSTRRTK